MCEVFKYASDLQKKLASFKEDQKTMDVEQLESKYTPMEIHLGLRALEEEHKAETKDQRKPYTGC